MVGIAVVRAGRFTGWRRYPVLALGVYVRSPVVSLIDGWTLKIPLLSFETWKVTVWLDSFDGPLLMFVANPLTV